MSRISFRSYRNTFTVMIPFILFLAVVFGYIVSTNNLLLGAFFLGTFIFVIALAKPEYVFLGLVAMNALFEWIPSVSYETRGIVTIGLPYAIPGLPLYTTDWVLFMLVGITLVRILLFKQRNKQHVSDKISSWIFLFLIVLGLAFIQGWNFNNDAADMRADFRTLLYFPATFFVAAHLIRGKILKSIIQMLLICALIKAGQGIYLTITEFSGRATPNGFMRVFVDTTIHQVLLFGFVLLLVMVLHGSYRQYLLLQVFGLLLIGYVLLMTFSRAVLLILLLLPLILVILERRQKFLRIAVIVTIIGGIFYILLLTEDKSFLGVIDNFERVQQGTQDVSIAYRLAEYPVVLSEVLNKPFLGAGLGGKYKGMLFIGSSFGYRTSIGSITHNLELYLLLKTGFLGLTFFFIIIVNVFRLAFRKVSLPTVKSMKQKDTSFLAVTLTVSLISFLILGQFGAMINHMGNSLFLGVIVAMIVNFDSLLLTAFDNEDKEKVFQLEKR